MNDSFRQWRSRVGAVSVLLMIASSIAAQAPAPPPIRLRVNPAAAPIPALKYKLLPELEHKTPCNAPLLSFRAYTAEWYTHLRQPNYPADPDNTNTTQSRCASTDFNSP